MGSEVNNIGVLILRRRNIVISCDSDSGSLSFFCDSFSCLLEESGPCRTSRIDWPPGKARAGCRATGLRSRVVTAVFVANFAVLVRRR